MTSASVQLSSVGSTSASQQRQYTLHFSLHHPPPPSHLPLLPHADRPRDLWVLHPRSFAELLEAAALGAAPPLFDATGSIHAGPVLLGLCLSGVYAVETTRRRNLHRLSGMLLGAIDDSGELVSSPAYLSMIFLIVLSAFTCFV
jgi:hypothetical protein